MNLLPNTSGLKGVETFVSEGTVYLSLSHIAGFNVTKFGTGMRESIDVNEVLIGTSGPNFPMYVDSDFNIYNHNLMLVAFASNMYDMAQMLTDIFIKDEFHQDCVPPIKNVVFGIYNFTVKNGDKSKKKNTMRLISESNIPEKVKNVLSKEGYVTCQDLIDAGETKLRFTVGIGKKAMVDIGLFIHDCIQ